MAEFKFDTEKVKSHIEKIIAFQHTFAGKLNHNPFIWLATHAYPLLDRLEKGEKTEALQLAILALKEVAPIVDANFKEPVPEKKEPIKPYGLNLPEKK